MRGLRRRVVLGARIGCCFTLLALVELAGKRRSWLVALLAVCAIESRFSMIAALPVYAYLLWLPRHSDAPVVRDEIMRALPVLPA